ncbi:MULTISPECIES: DUF3046 domain-containing protein [unclassified Arthrobacter]|uniref:DUF3046 domain-containing protein n=1 Tax=unclassified Arthrobacter TaxID=235627 RepID=UPI001491FBC4|nr:MULTISPECIES: DUF3046 domain-containing protein [unclassified Arthrobacter]MBE0011667.1 DUF3046 domain-containing protein [Arthrobacter sp. AET 35A]NOJ61251.1 DUF3046 domain-containing protein [Arthrobacter sp. 260]
MRTSAFWRLMDDEFGGGYSRTLARTIVLADLGGRTPEEALAAGISPREVWMAVCDLQDVPQERRLGRDITPK